MKKSVVFLTFLGVVVIMIGLGITYSGTQKAEVTTTEASYSFGNNYLHDDLSNETYLRGGDFTIQNCKSDTLEIVAIHPPVSFNQSKLGNVYFAMWEGGIKPSLPGNRPDKMIRADLVLEQTPNAFLFDLRVNTLSIELLSNETCENLGSSSTWNADFVRIHTLPASPDFIRLGIVLPDVGMAVVLLMSYLLDRPTVSARGLASNLRGKLFFLAPLKSQHSFLGKLWSSYTFLISRFHNRSKICAVPSFFYQLLFFEMAFLTHIPLCILFQKMSNDLCAAPAIGVMVGPSLLTKKRQRASIEP